MAEYYAQRAGAGLIITEGTFVSEQGQGWYGAPGIYSEEQRAGWERITDAVHSAGGLIFVQLWHQGSVSHRSLYDDGRLPLGPSAVNPEQLIHVKGGRIMSETPREMSLQDIKQAVRISDMPHKSHETQASTVSRFKADLSTFSNSSCMRSPTGEPTTTADRWRTAPAFSLKPWRRCLKSGRAIGSGSRLGR